MVEEEEGVGAFKQMMFLNCQPFFHLVLLANNNEKARVLLSKPVVSFAVREGGANEHDAVELIAEGAARLAHKGLGLA